MTADDYRAYLDADVLDFIDETDAWYPNDTYAMPIAEQRRIYDAMCRAFFRGYPAGVTARDHHAGHVPVRRYRRARTDPAAAVLYAHGGGNLVGGLSSHDDICADICLATGFDVIAVDYRLAPEYTRSDSVSDCAAALSWLRAELARPVILAGDSAGAFLVAALAIAERGASDLSGLATVYGSFGGFASGQSMTRHAHAPLLSAAEVAFYDRFLGLVGPVASHPVPLAEPSLGGLPPVFAAAAECDPLASQSREWVRRIRAAGGIAVCHLDKGLVHGHLRARHRAARAGRSFRRLTEVIARMALGGLDQVELQAVVTRAGLRRD